MSHSAAQGCAVRRCGLILLLMWLGQAIGCSLSQDYWTRCTWAGDYERAEQRFHQSGRDLLIAYRDGRPRAEDHMDRLLADGAVKPLLKPYVRCMLFSSYEPDRRYVAQFGVERAPALIILRQDGTYHAHSGPMQPEDVQTLLAAAAEPGKQPVYNHHIPRTAEYHWYRRLTSAEREAERTGKPLLILATRCWSQDAPRLKSLMAQHEVFIRCRDWVPCHLKNAWPWGVGGVRRFEVSQLPALVVLSPFGASYVLEEPESAAQIAHFLDECLERNTLGTATDSDAGGVTKVPSDAISIEAAQP